MRQRRVLQTLLLGVLFMGCDPGPLEWAEPVPAGQPDSPTRMAAAGPLGLASACPASLRLAGDASRGGVYAAWWALRPDSSAELIAAHSPDGTNWSAPVRVDTMDVGRTACRRPAPAIAAEGSHVYLAYGMAAREGPGIFASHSMDYGKLFHSPVAVVYGERFGLSAVVSRGDLVAVAFEDPNTKPRRIGLALSTTMGHPFQHRTLVSPPTGEASAPAVALGDGTVTVTWTSVPRGTTTPQRVSRTARIR